MTANDRGMHVQLTHKAKIAADFLNYQGGFCVCVFAGALKGCPQAAALVQT